MASFLKNLNSIISANVQRKKYAVISLTEHLGDIIAAEPIARYVREQFPGYAIWWVTNKKYEAIIQSNENISKCIAVSSFTEWILLKRFFKKKHVFDLHINNKVCDKYHFVNTKANPFEITYENYYNKGNLLFAFSRSGGLEIPYGLAPKLHLKDEEPLLAQPFVVIHADASYFTRTWKPECWNKLASFIIEKFPQVHIVEVGLNKIISIYNTRIIDKTGKRNYGELASLIRHCKLFIGVDSSFAHFANALEKEGLVLLGHANGFINYLPYSGKYQREKETIIHYYNGPLIEMPCDHIFQKVEQKLNVAQ